MLEKAGPSHGTKALLLAAVPWPLAKGHMNVLHHPQERSVCCELPGEGLALKTYEDCWPLWVQPPGFSLIYPASGSWSCVKCKTEVVVFSPPSSSSSFSFLFFFFFSFLGPHPWHTEIPRLGVELELQLPAYTTATWAPSHICDLYHSSQQHWILNLLSEARDRTYILMDTSRVCNPLSHNGNSATLQFDWSLLQNNLPKIKKHS